MEEERTIPIITEDQSNEEVLDCTALCNLIDFQRKNNPRLKGLSGADIADGCDMSESTYKALVKGKNRNPRVGTLVRLIKYIGGGSIDRLVGLAPTRDYNREEATYDKTLVEALQARLDAKKERLDEYAFEVDKLHTELASLRNELTEAYKELSAEKTKSNMIAEYKIRAHKYAAAFASAVVILGVLLTIIILILIDALDPHIGFIGGIVWR